MNLDSRYNWYNNKTQAKWKLQGGIIYDRGDRMNNEEKRCWCSQICKRKGSSQPLSFARQRQLWGTININVRAKIIELPESCFHETGHTQHFFLNQDIKSNKTRKRKNLGIKIKKLQFLTSSLSFFKNLVLNREPS